MSNSNWPRATQQKQSGFFDLPVAQFCTHPEHNFPTHLYIPPGQGYRHVCPGCKREEVSYNHGVFA
ncbi:hypothetical protein [Achromobacter phage Motura]|uniref:Uncharacterized protein n=1 Tax=Achromobacter phage Motura TaxID=2591403 RepID=A0A514CSS6_9CAUD|nr:hypothetical protein H1O15_gp280 [Achromobacter phage Motura]QDH83526.1 hypothetical protein [Achromobacter phage Motura]